MHEKKKKTCFDQWGGIRYASVTPMGVQTLRYGDAKDIHMEYIVLQLPGD